MRHLALDVELEYPLSHPNATIKIVDELREKIDKDKFRGLVKITVFSYSQREEYEHNAFHVAKVISSLIDVAVESKQQIIALNVRIHRDCWEMVKIDIVEVIE